MRRSFNPRKNYVFDEYDSWKACYTAHFMEDAGYFQFKGDPVLNWSFENFTSYIQQFYRPVWIRKESEDLKRKRIWLDYARASLDNTEERINTKMAELRKKQAAPSLVTGSQEDMDLVQTGLSLGIKMMGVENSRQRLLITEWDLDARDAALGRLTIL
jgi:hypothetical protein